MTTSSLSLRCQLMALITVRKLMDYFYTQQDLSWLDHLLPEDDRRKEEDQEILKPGELIAPQKRPVTVLAFVLFRHFIAHNRQ